MEQGFTHSVQMTWKYNSIRNTYVEETANGIAAWLSPIKSLIITLAVVEQTYPLDNPITILAVESGLVLSAKWYLNSDKYL